MPDTDVSKPSLRGQIQRHSVALISLVIAVTGLAYNTYRNELTESNRNVRAAGFEMILVITKLHETLFIGHYSPEKPGGDAKTGWALILALVDLSFVMPTHVQTATQGLLNTWQQQTAQQELHEADVKQINDAIDALRAEIHIALESLD